MSFFDQDLGCCGANFEKNNISFLGLLTLSATAVILLSLVWVISLPIYLVTKSWHNLLGIIIRANSDLIKNSSILRKTKCEVAGKILRYSPRLSGLFFKSFNFVILYSAWSLCFICLFWMVLK